MASPAAPVVPAEVFQASLGVERQWLRDVVHAILGAICFARVAGQVAPLTVDVLGVSFPAVANPDVQELVDAKADLLVKVLTGEGADGGRAKLFVSLYPTPFAPLPPPSSRLRSPTPSNASTARPASPSLPSSASPTRGSLRRPASLAQAAPAAVTSALGWFSASARAALGGDTATTSRGGIEQAGSTGRLEGQEEELKLLETLQADGKSPFEGWCIEFEVLKDGSGTRGRGPGEAEERLRSQLNDFLLRSLNFTMLHTSHIPPITTADLMPFGVLVLIDPPLSPFAVPKPVVVDVESFPALHKALVSGGRNEQRRPQSAGGRW